MEQSLWKLYNTLLELRKEIKELSYIFLLENEVWKMLSSLPNFLFSFSLRVMSQVKIEEKRRGYIYLIRKYEIPLKESVYISYFPIRIDRERFDSIYLLHQRYEGYISIYFERMEDGTRYVFPFYFPIRKREMIFNAKKNFFELLNYFLNYKELCRMLEKYKDYLKKNMHIIFVWNGREKGRKIREERERKIEELDEIIEKLSDIGRKAEEMLLVNLYEE